MSGLQANKESSRQNTCLNRRQTRPHFLISLVYHEWMHACKYLILLRTRAVHRFCLIIWPSLRPEPEQIPVSTTIFTRFRTFLESAEVLKIWISRNRQHAGINVLHQMEVTLNATKFYCTPPKIIIFCYTKWNSGIYYVYISLIFCFVLNLTQYIKIINMLTGNIINSLLYWSLLPFSL